MLFIFSDALWFITEQFTGSSAKQTARFSRRTEQSKQCQGTCVSVYLSFVFILSWMEKSNKYVWLHVWFIFVFFSNLLNDWTLCPALQLQSSFIVKVFLFSVLRCGTITKDCMLWFHLLMWWTMACWERVCHQVQRGENMASLPTITR